MVDAFSNEQRHCIKRITDGCVATTTEKAGNGSFRPRSQYTSHDWQTFLKTHGLQGSMSRRGNCHDNAVTESFFQLLKRERIKRKIYSTRDEARSDVFDYIEMFYNSKRKHGSNNLLSPVEYENRYQERLGSV